MKKVSGPQVVTAAEAVEMPLPAQIQDALGECIAIAAKRHRHCRRERPDRIFWRRRAGDVSTRIGSIRGDGCSRNWAQV